MQACRPTDKSVASKNRYAQNLPLHFATLRTQFYLGAANCLLHPLLHHLTPRKLGGVTVESLLTETTIQELCDSMTLMYGHTEDQLNTSNRIFKKLKVLESVEYQLRRTADVKCS